MVWFKRDSQGRAPHQRSTEATGRQHSAVRRAPVVPATCLRELRRFGMGDWESEQVIRTLLGAPGHTTRSKKLLGAPGLTTSNKKLLETELEVIRITFTVIRIELELVIQLDDHS